MINLFYSMNLKIKTYNSIANRYGLPRFNYQISTWLTPYDLNLICDNYGINPDRGAIYVKMEYKHLLQSVVLYTKLDTFCSNTDVENGYIYIPKELLPSQVYLNENDNIEVTIVNIDNLPYAQSITIKLPKEEVSKWSEDEAKEAAKKFKLHNKISYKTQRTPIDPVTKNAVIASVDCIYPQIDDACSAYILDNDTLINFEGLPENLQKTIDLSQVGGLDNVINRIREIIQIPINYPEYFSYFGIERPKGLLLYGPPGNGKSMIAKGLAKSLGSSFIEIDLTDALSKWVGGGEKLLKSKFKEAESYNEGVIFIDEIDSLAQIRTDKSEGHEVTLVGTLLSLMDGLKSNSKVFVIGATNRPDAIDPALRRPGRLDLEIEIPLPNLVAREDIINKYLKLDNNPTIGESIDCTFVKRLAELTSGYSGADIKALYREAAMTAIRKWLNISKDDGKLEMLKELNEIKLEKCDFLDVIRNNVPSALRGMEIRKDVVQWEDLLVLDEEKNRLERLNQQLASLINNISIYSDRGLLVRPSFANILITGKKGTGKHTFVSSFARHFEYEMFEVDFISLEAMDITESYRNIDMIFSKCRQITPSILVLSNLEKVQKPELYIHKVLNEINKIAKHLQIFVFCLCDDDSLKEKLCDYKGFSEYFNFDKDESYINEIISIKYGSDILSNIKLDTNRIGAALAAVHEYQLLNNN